MFLMLHIIHSSRSSWSWFSYHSVKRTFVTTFLMMVNKTLLGQTSDKLNQSNNKRAEDISLFQLYSPHQRVQPGWSRPQAEQSRAEQNDCLGLFSHDPSVTHSRWSFPSWQQLCTSYSHFICRPLQTPNSFSVFPTYSPPLSALLHTLLHCISAWGFQKHLSFANNFLF